MQAPAPMVLLLHQGCRSGAPPTFVCTTGASPSSRHRHHACLLRRGRTPAKKEGGTLGRSRPIAAMLKSVRCQAGSRLRRVGEEAAAPPCIDPRERGLLLQIYSRERRERVERLRIRIPRWDLAGIWRVRRWAEVLGRTGQRRLASG
jgi:hypothetical protein